MPTQRQSRSTAPSARRRNWSRLDDEELLELRFCDLGLRLDKTPLVRRIDRLGDELENRGIRFRPHVWLSEEWFSPDGVPGIAVPFYLADPRLMQLEKRQLLEVEGGNEAWCMMILRHEAGHAIDTAYRLHRRRRWRDIFGKRSKPYPAYYKPRPRSKNYVVHLGQWYAQSHPCEDFAETFAVWLTPRSGWRTQYEGWGAQAKLEYVDELMDEIGDLAPPVRSRRHVDPLRQLTKTLREHYEEKRAHYEVELPSLYERDLKRIFQSNGDTNGHVTRRPTAASFLRQYRSQLREKVARRTGAYAYAVDQILSEFIDGCKDLRLRLRGSQRQTQSEVVDLLSFQTMKLMRNGSQHIPL